MSLMMPPRAGLREDFSREGRSNNLKVNMKKPVYENLEQNSSSIGRKTAPETVPAPVSTVKNIKLLDIPIMQKLGDEIVDKSVNPRVATEEDFPRDMPKKIKKPPLIIQPNQRTNNETAVSVKAFDSQQDFQKRIQNESNLSTCMEDEKISENKPHKATACIEDTIEGVGKSSIHEGEEIPKSETSGLLTENEEHLKQVLIFYFLL
ncbi:hypothetical protein Scep_019103 [Stephania cephalantha]|uniref:Uncharacterized protein n=1 Tax=Stephania cephalantha TaxID=152367 RepID=A0AAP0IA81_9MAGN